MTGTILHAGATDVLYMGIINGDDGKQYHYQQGFEHLDGSDRALGVGVRVTFGTHVSFPGFAHSVYKREA